MPILDQYEAGALTALVSAISELSLPDYHNIEVRVSDSNGNHYATITKGDAEEAMLYFATIPSSIQDT